MNPVLETARLNLHCWGEDDFELAMELWGDPAVTRYLIDEPLGPEQVRARLENERAWWDQAGVQYWKVLTRSGDFVGCAGAAPRRWPGRPEPTLALEAPFELGFAIVPRFWGQGLTTEAAAAAMQHCWQALGAPALFAGHHPDNAASRRILTRLGFAPVGHELFEPTGLMHPSYVATRPI